MLVVTRYVVPEAEGPAFLQQARAALAALAGCRGHLAGHVGRSSDDPGLWVLATEWESVGAYRRALSSYEVKVHAVPLMYRSVDEPTAFEVLDASGRAAADGDAGERRSRRAADADVVGLGEASAPLVPSDLD
ncbi:MAG TPA: antibiotic biosynthesis monooxygenase [Motilibacteraceae bacterium]|nr:antibiotic biosynthesis monooxygenase [Motilibacteraceae bacterium]